jgi:hypothetical protein
MQADRVRSCVGPDVFRLGLIPMPLLVDHLATLAGADTR